MKLKYSVPFVTGAAIALLGAGLIGNTRVEVAEAAIQCVQDLQHPLLSNEEEHRALHECEGGARRTGITLLEALAIFGLFGWGAGALGFAAGGRESEKAWQKWNADRAKRPS